MGACQCFSRDNMSQKTVDITSLKNDLNNTEKDPSTGPKLMKEKDKYKPDEIIEDNKDKDELQNQPQEEQAKQSNRSKNNNPIIILRNEESNVDNNQNVILLQNMNVTQESIVEAHKHETMDSRILCSKRTVSRFLNRTYINIVILGGKGVGKSAFVIKYIENVFEKLYIPTLGSEEGSKKFSYNTHIYDLKFTVTTGSIDYQSDYSKAYQEADYFLVFYDVTSMQSFEVAKKILKSDVKNYLYCYGQSMTNVILVGNKIDDRPRNVPEELAKNFCQKNEFQMFDISVKTNKNISAMMKSLIKAIDDIAYPN